MVYVKTVTTSAATQQATPLESFIDVSRGLLYRAQVMFPPGCNGVVGVKVFEGGHQMFPASLDEWLIGSNETIDFEDLYFITIEKTRLRILTYNTSVFHSHITIVRLGVVGRPEFIAHFLPTVGYSDLEKIIEEVTAQKQAENIKSALDLAAQLPEEEG
jgi:hypothetical protein